MLFFEDWIDRVVEREGQIIKNLRELSFDYDYLYRHVFMSALEQMHRSRPVIAKTTVVGPRWVKTPDCQEVIRCMSNFLLTNSSTAAAIYSGREVRQNFEENDLTVYVPMGYSTLHYVRRFEFNFAKRIENYPLSREDIYPDIPYEFVLPFGMVGDVEINSNGHDKSEFIVSYRDDEAFSGRTGKRKVTVIYKPADGSKEPIRAHADKLEDAKGSNLYDIFNSFMIEATGPIYYSHPTLALTGFSKYPYFDSNQWRNDSELIELLMESRFVRAIAQSKSVFTVSEVEFNPNTDSLIARASSLEEKANEMLTKNNSWWEF